MKPKITMRLHKLLALVLVVVAPLAARAQNITTVVGGGPVNLNPLQSSPGSPAGVRRDSLGNTYIVDNNFNRLLRIDHATGNLSVVAGSGPFGYTGDDVPGLEAQLAGPSGLCIDSQDNVYVADSDNGLVREYVVTASAGKTVGHLINVAGVQTEDNFTYGGEGGPALSANIHFPDGCSFDSHGNLYIADRGNNAIRVVIGSAGVAPAGLSSVTAGHIYLFAGSTDGTTGVAPSAGVAANDAVAVGAALNGPFDVFVDAHDNVYIGLVGNPPPAVNPPPTASLIRYVPAATGGGKTLGHIYTVAGAVSGGTANTSNILATNAALSSPRGISVDANGNVIFAEASNRIIREVPGTAATPAGMTAGNIYTIAGSGGHGNSGNGDTALDPRVSFAAPVGTFLDSNGDLYIADSSAGVVRVVDGSNSDYTQRIINLFAGNSHVSYANATTATAGQLFTPAGITTNNNGDLIIADAGSSVLRGVSAAGGLITVAGQPEFFGFGGDGGSAASSVVNNAQNVVVDANNNGYIADTDNCIVRKIDGGGNISTIAGTIPSPIAGQDPEFTTPNCGFAGAGGAALSATLGAINGIAVDAAGNVFFSDGTNNVIWEVPAVASAGKVVGNIYVVAGTHSTTGAFGGDNGPATAAQFSNPTSLFVDAFNNLYIADTGNHVIREIPATTANGLTKGNIYTMAGTGTANDYTGDGAAANQAKLDSPFGIFVDANGSLFITDTNNHVVREVPATTGGGMTKGFIYTVAGTGKTPGFGGDGGAATSALLTHPKGLAQGPNDALLVADSDNNRIRSIANLTSNPALRLSNYSLDFPNQPLLLPSTSQPIVINNAGTTGLTLTAVSISGTDAADFAVNPSCAGALAAGASCTVQVTFTPTVATAENATLTISDTTGDTRTVALTGSSIPAVPGANVTPATLTFTAQAVGTQSAGQAVTLTNNGTGKLTGVVPTFTGTNAGDFSETDNCAIGVNVGAHCTITVKFKPLAGAATARAATLSIADSASTSPQTVAITGTAAFPIVGLNSSTLTFTNVVVNTTSASQDVMLSNTGTSALAVTSIAASGVFTQTNTCGTTVAAGANCTISVKFAPTAVGPATGAVTITDNATPATQTITLNGTAVPAGPSVTLSSTNLTFADVLVGNTSATAQVVTLTNNSATALSVSSITVIGTNAGDFPATNTCTTAPVAANGGHCTISVNFAPSAAGARTAGITITDNATPDQQAVNLSGNGFAVTLTPTASGGTTQTVTAGATATYNLQFATTATTSTTPISVAVACSGAPSKAVCTAPAAVSVTPGTAAPFSVTISTTAASMIAPQSEPDSQSPTNLPLAQLATAGLLFAIATMLAATKSPAFRMRAIRATVTACLVLTPIVAGSFLTGCAGGSGSSSTPTPPAATPGTPAGTYTITLTSTVAGKAQTNTLTLIVQ
jgi:trimeric autotransporter adhesin